MRVISGKYKGAKLNSLDGEHTRPTTDRVKEAVFSIIQFEIEDAVIFEPFAGSGQMSIEAISRNANFAYVNDNDKKAFEIIKSNIVKIKNEDKFSITNLPYEKSILELKKAKKIDIVFLDPPYNSDLLVKSLELITKNVNLSNKSIIICEHSIDNIPANRYNEFILLKTYKYSKIGISIYRHEMEVKI